MNNTKLIIESWRRYLAEQVDVPGVTGRAALADKDLDRQFRDQPPAQKAAPQPAPVQAARKPAPAADDDEAGGTGGEEAGPAVRKPAASPAQKAQPAAAQPTPQPAAALPKGGNPQVFELQQLLNSYFKSKNQPGLPASAGFPTGEDGKIGRNTRAAMARVAASDRTAPKDIPSLIKWLQSKTTAAPAQKPAAVQPAAAQPAPASSEDDDNDLGIQDALTSIRAAQAKYASRG